MRKRFSNVIKGTDFSSFMVGHHLWESSLKREFAHERVHLRESSLKKEFAEES